MSPLPSTRVEPFAGARASLLFSPTLAAPVVLVLLLSALAHRDPVLLGAALVVLGASLAAGALAALVALRLQLGQRDGVVAFIGWVGVLGAPIALLWWAAILIPSLSRVLAPLRDVLPASDELRLALISVCALSAGLLAVGIPGNAARPVVLRHRRELFGERTVFALMALLLPVTAATYLTNVERFPSGEGAQLRAQLPQLERDASTFPNHFLSQYRLGNVLLRLDECAAALPPLQRAVALQPNDGWAENDLGGVLSCLRRPREAIAPFRVAVRVMPDEPRPRYGLAWALEQTGDYTGALAGYQAIRHRWPNDPVAMAREAVARYNHGEREEGLSEVRRALAAGPSEYWVLLSAAQLFSSAALLSEAAAQYGRLAARDSGNMWLWVQYGSAAYLAGQLAEARRAFDHVDSLPAQQALVDPAWRAMRDAARKGIPPSELPPIPPYTWKPAGSMEAPARR